MKVLYYDCFAGISGDMNLGALLDLGVDRKYLLKELGKLSIGSYKIKIYQDKRGGITGTKFDVLIPASKKTSSPLGRQNRSYRDIAKLIRQSQLSAYVKKTSLNIFTRLAEAEGKIHGCKTENVHFHEVGAIDSIVDVVGAAVCLDYLKVDKIIASPVELGSGIIHCNHGTLPVPAPATAEILKGIPVKTGLVPFEATTPTGAAILAATASAFTDNIDFTPLKIGYGLGSREPSVPNVLRVFLGEKNAAISSDTQISDAVVIECNIDDMIPECYDNLMELLFAAGAHDVFFTPIVMKKSRPAATVSVLCDVSQQPVMEDILWRHSSTFGLRSYKVTKSMLQRKIIQVKTRYGTVRVKCGYLNGRLIKSKPEYEDCKKLAEANGVALRDIYESVHAKMRTET
ncbi:MAG TPA: nickel pincer cofactor biosynthesis protein LarC [Smithella sp.]|nr:nickel pincer cofactor biosynthesis protein LarC [Smithella sp.]HNY49505.1 nickel pincer cofactor biosynthesis protein LarC [Smithella sp.]HOG89581.1 nickel pincer cofactor biosynthesis protein LarC [Smithella sp.]